MATVSGARAGRARPCGRDARRVQQPAGSERCSLQRDARSSEHFGRAVEGLHVAPLARSVRHCANARGSLCQPGVRVARSGWFQDGRAHEIARVWSPTGSGRLLAWMPACPRVPVIASWVACSSPWVLARWLRRAEGSRRLALPTTRARAVPRRRVPRAPALNPEARAPSRLTRAVRSPAASA